MDKRHLNFIFASLAVLYIWTMMNNPPVLDPEENDPAAVEQELDKEGLDREEGQPLKKGAADPKETKQDPKPKTEKNGDTPALEEEPDDGSPLYTTLGSMDPKSGFRMLVTFSRTGAAVHRAELSEASYLDLDIRSGYLGNLALLPTKNGLKIQVVGNGTPAAAAGLTVGDVITGIESFEKETSASEMLAVTTVADFTKALSTSKPGQKIKLKVIKKGAKESSSLTVDLTRRPLSVLRPERENYLARHATVPKDMNAPGSFLLTLSKRNKEVLDKEPELPGVTLRQGKWNLVSQTETSVTFSKTDVSSKLLVLKRYTLQQVSVEDLENRDAAGYGLTLDIVIKNIGTEKVAIAYQLDGANGLPLEGTWYAHNKKYGRNWSGHAMRDVTAKFLNEDIMTHGGRSISTSKEDVDPFPDAPLAYIGIDSQYFAAMLIPQKTKIGDRWFDAVDSLLVTKKPDPTDKAAVKKYRHEFANVSYRLHHVVQTLQPGEKTENNDVDKLIQEANVVHDSYLIFIGPKRTNVLTAYHAAGTPSLSLKSLLYYGWFTPVSKILTVVLHFFYSLVGNYGIAIILLTVSVRGLMFPLSLKQTRNMAKMQELQPEISRIKKLYKDDIEKQTKAQQELWKKNNYNPAGGCMMSFIQLPIFMGLYRALMVDIDLRQKPLFSESISWCSNLAAPDMLWDWSHLMPDWVNAGGGFFSLGPYLNLLPLITVLFFLLQQKMFMPPATDDTTKMSQSMMKYMMLFMGLMFYTVASGLCLYFIASSMWGIAERILLKKEKEKGTSAKIITVTDGMKISDSSSKKTGSKRQSAKNKKKK